MPGHTAGHSIGSGRVRTGHSLKSHHRANGSGRTWNLTTWGWVPLPVSRWNGVRLPSVVHTPRPFQPAFGSSIRPSIHLAKKPSGYGTRMLTHLPSTQAISDSLALPVAIGTLAPRPEVLNWSTQV